MSISNINEHNVCGIPKCFKRKVQQLCTVLCVLDISQRKQTNFACIIMVYYEYVFR